MIRSGMNRSDAILVILAFLHYQAVYVEAQGIKSGPCPSIPVQPDFDQEKYVGKWYETEKTYAYYEIGLKCITAEYTNRLNGGFDVVNSGISVIGNAPSTIRGTASVSNPNEPAKLILQLLGIPIPADYWVVDTDYENYSVVFSCSSMSLGLSHTENLFVLSRTPSLDFALRQKIYEGLDAKNVDRSGLQATDQKNCPANH